MMSQRRRQPPVSIGEIWYGTLDPIVGHEEGGTRPLLIVSGNRFNQIPHGLCVVAPLTSRIRSIPAHVLINPPEGGLSAPSVVMCDQLRTVSLERLKNRRGVVTHDTLMAVRAAVREVLDI